MNLRFYSVLFLTQLTFVGCATMSNQPVEKSYLDWEPVLKAEEVFQQTVGFSFFP
jgi:hypothetical protein